MAFQALLFCPDDKTARTVTQVLSELEFTVEPCTEPFAAVKKLMSGHYDALVVDCDNEQNATLLFKSARNSTSNQTSLAVAIVEGQAGVAKAFRIGANLVLTKPINVEQSKGTLRVARGLLRKGEPIKPGMPAAPPAPAAGTAVASAPATASVSAANPAAAKPAAAKPAPPPKPVAPARPTAAASIPKSAPPVTPGPVRRPSPAELVQPPDSVAAVQAAASSGLAEPDQIPDIKGTDSVRTTPAPAPSVAGKSAGATSTAKLASPVLSGPGSGAASAPAPAREAHPVEASAPAASKTDNVVEMHPASASSEAAISASESAPAPSFTFGGANAEEQSDGGRKKIFLVVAAVLLVVVLGYAAYSHFSGGTSQVAPTPAKSPTQTPASSAATPNSAPALAQPGAVMPAPANQGSLSDTSLAGNSANTAGTDSSESGTAPEPPHSSKPSPSSSSSSSTAATKTAAVEKTAPEPLVVKSGAARHPKSDTSAPDISAPSVDAIAASGSNGALANLVSSGSAPSPILQRVNVSQGVSQGLLIKKVQPSYPKTALVMRIEGEVDLTATISKTGEITSVKALKGDPQLTKAAVDAVKQWKYKPYLLNGEPVEITTQVTINFKLPN
jgi:periplasmic protein TonB